MSTISTILGAAVGMCLAAHVIVCLDEERPVLLLLGLVLFPVGVAHGARILVRG
jgi:hypothetical protein